MKEKILEIIELEEKVKDIDAQLSIAKEEYENSIKDLVEEKATLKMSIDNVKSIVEEKMIKKGLSIEHHCRSPGKKSRVHCNIYRLVQTYPLKAASKSLILSKLKPQL